MSCDRRKVGPTVASQWRLVSTDVRVSGGLVNTLVRVYVPRVTRLTPEAMRAGRALLRWTLRDLASASGVALSTVHQYEKGDRDARDGTAQKIVATFAAHGVEVLNGDAPGARLLPPPE